MEEGASNAMIRIAVIGSIGSGKSFIAKLFKYPVFNADNEVKNLYKYNKKCFKELKKKIPNLINTFPISKQELINAINKNKKNLHKIASVVHPFVKKKMRMFLQKNKNSKIIVLDIPLLIENKLHNKNDVLIYIKSSKKNILSRLKKRKLYNNKTLNILKENQIVLKKKRKLANYTVVNNYSPNIMKNKINSLKLKILNERNCT